MARVEIICTYSTHVDDRHSSLPTEVIEEGEGYDINSIILTVICEILLIIRAILTPISGG